MATRSSIAFLLTALAASVSSTALGAPSPKLAGENEIMVTLFGQPCVLSGALDKDTLRKIHTISPEQTFVDPSSVAADPIRRSLDKLKSAKNIPVWLEAYRDKKAKRLEAQLAFANGFASAKKLKKAEPLLAAVKAFVPERRIKALSTLASEIESKKTDPNLELRLLDLYNEMIEPDPEEDFHRAIRRMNVRYSCEFSDEGDSEDGPDTE